MKSFDYTSYLSPFTWRYGSNEMRQIWSEVYKRKLWRKIWVELAKAQSKRGLIKKNELEDLIKNKDNIDIEKAEELEKEIRHDLMAEIKTFAEQARIGGGKIHLGATSMDIEDNADAIREKESLVIIEEGLKNILKAFAKKIKRYSNTPCMAYTHLQPAEPTTLGYRFSLYAQDLLFDLKFLSFVKKILKSKGFKGAVGTSASYSLLLKNKTLEMEKEIMKNLGLSEVLISGQTTPRKFEFFIASALGSIAQTLYKFAFDLRILQSPGFLELSEPFSQKQIGSSAMPFKKNPWKSEQICSLARLIFHLSSIPLANAANSLLERTLDDSANRRIFLPEMFLALDEILQSTSKVVDGLVVNEKQIANNLTRHGLFSATEIILLQAVKKGADRQLIHEALRQNAMIAYEKINNGKPNPLLLLLSRDKKITKFIDKNKIKKMLNPKNHLGLAPKKCLQILKIINNALSS